MPQDSGTTFDTWAIVELFGHNVLAGRVTEQVVAGQGFVRVDVPAVNDVPGYSRLFGPGAIYSITPCPEEVATAYAANLRARPIQIYQIALPSVRRDDEEDI
ncbi:MAG TPA: hypothetical protein VFF78_07970 [Anaerolineaceae bacterium]|nr:hypothetical protein [Anaerolineaceae bacterium]